ncbi:hypothetical protein F4692_000758 [Nocardioides cavernae]|uniref:Uncharacterized protein n=1 Tax=Nocardioides cavernae TaxID=1921566 RepID=A0A7Y9KQK4_9ACTN|nr:hypothetical protein [Nocardioides cavernae]
MVGLVRVVGVSRVRARARDSLGVRHGIAGAHSSLFLALMNVHPRLHGDSVSRFVFAT